MSNTHLCSKSVHERGVVREADAESGGGATGLAGDAGVGADDGEGRGIESTSRVGLLDGRVADGLRIEFALDHDETGGGDGKCKIENGKWKITHVGRGRSPSAPQRRQNR